MDAVEEEFASSGGTYGSPVQPAPYGVLVVTGWSLFDATGRLDVPAVSLTLGATARAEHPDRRRMLYGRH